VEDQRRWGGGIPRHRGQRSVGPSGEDLCPSPRGSATHIRMPLSSVVGARVKCRKTKEERVTTLIGAGGFRCVERRVPRCRLGRNESRSGAISWGTDFSSPPGSTIQSPAVREEPATARVIGSDVFFFSGYWLDPYWRDLALTSRECLNSFLKRLRVNSARLCGPNATEEIF